MQELAGLTGMYGYFAKAIDYSNGGYGEGILSRENVNGPVIVGGDFKITGVRDKRL